MFRKYFSDLGLWLILVVAAILFSVFTGKAAADFTIQEFTGTARNEYGQLEYVEKHQITYEDDRVVSSLTRYYDPQNRFIGDLTSEYSAGIQFGSYDFRDKRGGRENGAKVEQDYIRIYSRKEGDSEMRTKNIPRVSNQIVGQGFHHYIVKNIDAIASGTILHVRMVLPAQLDDYKFRIRKLKKDESLITIRLEIDNWFLRLFAPHMDTDYHLPSKRLFRYEGVSNLMDTAGDYKEVTIEYSYDT